MQFVCGLYASRGDAFYRHASHIAQAHVTAVVSSVVVGIYTNALGTNGMILGTQHLGHLRVFHSLTNLSSHKLSKGVIHFFANERIAHGPHETGSAGLPILFEHRLKLSRAQLLG